MPKRIVSSVTVFALILMPVEGGFAQADRVAAPRKVHYAPTELDKAKGKCVATVIGGALLGGLLGAAAGGKHGAGAGAATGAAFGAGACAIILANARHKDAIIQAQIASATYQQTPYVTTIESDDGQFTQFQGRAGQSQMIDGARLAPVRYRVDGQAMASPVLDTGGRECRPVNGSLASQALPQQLVCRTPDGDWKPYAQAKA